MRNEKEVVWPREFPLTAGSVGVPVFEHAQDHKTAGEPSPEAMQLGSNRLRVIGGHGYCNAIQGRWREMVHRSALVLKRLKSQKKWLYRRHRFFFFSGDC